MRVGPIAVLIMLLSNQPYAYATPFQGEGSGTFTCTLDGEVSTFQVKTAGTSTLGQSIYRGTTTFLSPIYQNPNDPLSWKTCQLSDGDPGVTWEARQSSGEIVLEDRGESLFVRLSYGSCCTSRRICFDRGGNFSVGCTSNYSGVLVITGGTGSLANARGHIEIETEDVYTYLGRSRQNRLESGCEGTTTIKLFGDLEIPGQGQ